MEMQHILQLLKNVLPQILEDVYTRLQLSLEKIHLQILGVRTFRRQQATDTMAHGALHCENWVPSGLSDLFTAHAGQLEGAVIGSQMLSEVPIMW